jgi:hypothetical protein
MKNRNIWVELNYYSRLSVYLDIKKKLPELSIISVYYIQIILKL